MTGTGLFISEHWARKQPISPFRTSPDPSRNEPRRLGPSPEGGEQPLHQSLDESHEMHHASVALLNSGKYASFGDKKRQIGVDVPYSFFHNTLYFLFRDNLFDSAPPSGGICTPLRGGSSWPVGPEGADRQSRY